MNKPAPLPLRKGRKTGLWGEPDGLDSLAGDYLPAEKMVGRARFELATNGLKVRCSTG